MKKAFFVAVLAMLLVRVALAGLESVTYLNDLVTTNPTAGDPQSEGDDHLRNIKAALKNTFPGMAGAAWRVQTKAANYTALTTDNMTLLDFSAAATLNFTAAASLGNQWTAIVYARGGDVILDPNGAETVNGAATYTVYQDMMAVVTSTGSAVYARVSQAVLTKGSLIVGGSAGTPTTITAGSDGAVLVSDSTAISGVTWSASGFTTGDVKLTLKTTADTGWVLMNDGTIGDASSGATTRANADTSALFTLIYTSCSDTYCAVSGGRGASAAADYAAHKTIALPKALGRALAAYGSGSGLTARSMGQTLGEETHLLTAAESGLVNHSHTASSTFTGTDTLDTSAGGAVNIIAQGSGTQPAGGAVHGSVSTTVNASGSSSASSAHNVMQPTVFLNVMVKL